MSLALRYSLFIVLSVIGVLICAGLSINFWFVPVAQHFLPPKVSIETDGRFGLTVHGIRIPTVTLTTEQCKLVTVQGARLAYSSRPFALQIASVSLESQCFQKLPPSDGAIHTQPLSLQNIQHLLPAFNIDIHQFSVGPWQSYQGALHFSSTAQQQSLQYHGVNLRIEATLTGQKLNVKQLKFTHSVLAQPLELSGHLRLADSITTLPDTVDFQATLSISSYPHPLSLTLRRDADQGLLKVDDNIRQQTLLSAPWKITPTAIILDAGQWAWPTDEQTFGGRFSLTAENWKQGFSQTVFTGRVNALTDGRGGKGNVVLSLGPGKLDLIDNQFPMRLTGTAKFDNLQFYVGLPAQLIGSLLQPQIHFQPKALLWMRGELLPGWEVDEARWPIAGVKLNSQGFSGLLQANLMVRNEQSSFYLLHLAGMAKDFLPDRGRWDWRYWGKGMVLPFTANWDISGRGYWHDEEITLTSLSTGFDKIRYGKMLMLKPRITLSAPAHWVTQQGKQQFTGKFNIQSQATDFGETSQLPPAQLNVTVNGTTPNQFGFKGELVAKDIGPVRVTGRRDNERWLGQAWWSKQPLKVFQPLVGPTNQIAIRDGTLRAQAAFSMTPEKGFQAGGHWVVSDGDIWLPDYQFSGANFVLPFRFTDHRWHFGVQAPVSLHIATIENKFPMSDVKLSLKGSWPWDEKYPLDISDVSMNILGGQLSMDHLHLPQHKSALLKIKHIGMSQLLTAIHPKQIAMSGYVSGELPFWIENSPWLIEKGWIKNDHDLTLRVDKQMIDHILDNNIAAGAAIDWLRYMEISKSFATIDVTAKGDLVMKSTVHGTSRFDDKDQRVNLNYHHTENIFMLWRSLNYGDNLQSWIEEQTRLPPNKEYLQ